MNEFIYKIWDKEEETYWQTGSGKSSWNSAAFAKSAFTDKVPWEEKRGRHPKTGSYFDTLQSRYKIHRFKIVFDKEM